MAPSEAIHRNNPALLLLEARERLARQAQDEADGYVAAEGRQFASVGLLKEILQMRGRVEDEADGGGGGKGRVLGFVETADDGEIEKRFGMKRGSVGKLGRKGVIENA